MIIYVDIDNTICYYDNINNINYSDSKPYIERIKKINELFNENNTIIYLTARGTKTDINWFEITLEQLNKWNCKFNELRMNKPVYDLFIDDKNINSEDYFKTNETS